MTTDPGQLEQLIGGPPLVVTVAGATVPAAALGPVTIRRGRSDVDSRHEAATLTMTLATDQLPVGPTKGDPVTVKLSDAAAAWAGLSAVPKLTAAWRFTGRVSDLVATPPTRHQLQPLLVLTAVGPKARMAAVTIGTADLPADAWGYRADALVAQLAAARPGMGVTTPGGGVGPQLVARPADPASAVDLFEQLADNVRGTFAEMRDGTMVLAWPGRDPGVGQPGTLALTAAQILVPSSFRQTPGGLVNDLTVTYGTAPAGGGDRPTVRVTAPTTTTDTLAAAALDVQLATAADALALARDEVGRRSRDRWAMQGLALDLAALDRATAAALLQLDVTGLVRVSGLPTFGPYTAARLWCEGMTETLTRDRWTFDLDVSDYALSAQGPTLASVSRAPAPTRFDWRTRRVQTATTTNGPQLVDLVQRPDLILSNLTGWDVQLDVPTYH